MYYVIYYNNFARLFTLGIIPAILLVYLNFKVSSKTFGVVFWKSDFREKRLKRPLIRNENLSSAKVH